MEIIIIELIDWFLQPIPIFLYICIGLIFWYLVYGSTCGIDGGNFGPGMWLLPFVFFYKELKWRVTGQKKLKAEFIEFVLEKEDYSGLIWPEEGVWKTKVVNDKNFYDEFEKDVLGDPMGFWLMYVIIPLFWPLLLVVVIACIVGLLVQKYLTALYKLVCKYLQVWYRLICKYLPVKSS